MMLLIYVVVAIVTFFLFGNIAAEDNARLGQPSTWPDILAVSVCALGWPIAWGAVLFMVARDVLEERRNG